MGKDVIIILIIILSYKILIEYSKIVEGADNNSDNTSDNSSNNDGFISSIKKYIMNADNGTSKFYDTAMDFYCKNILGKYYNKREKQCNEFSDKIVPIKCKGTNENKSDKNIPCTYSILNIDDGNINCSSISDKDDCNEKSHCKYDVDGGCKNKDICSFDNLKCIDANYDLKISEINTIIEFYNDIIDNLIVEGNDNLLLDFLNGQHISDLNLVKEFTDIQEFYNLYTQNHNTIVSVNFKDDMNIDDSILLELNNYITGDNNPTVSFSNAVDLSDAINQLYNIFNKDHTSISISYDINRVKSKTIIYNNVLRLLLLLYFYYKARIDNGNRLSEDKCPGSELNGSDMKCFYDADNDMCRVPDRSIGNIDSCKDKDVEDCLNEDFCKVHSGWDICSPGERLIDNSCIKVPNNEVKGYYRDDGNGNMSLINKDTFFEMNARTDNYFSNLETIKRGTIQAVDTSQRCYSDNYVLPKMNGAINYDDSDDIFKNGMGATCVYNYECESNLCSKTEDDTKGICVPKNSIDKLGDHISPENIFNIKGTVPNEEDDEYFSNTKCVSCFDKDVINDINYSFTKSDSGSYELCGIRGEYGEQFSSGLVKCDKRKTKSGCEKDDDKNISCEWVSYDYLDIPAPDSMDGKCIPKCPKKYYSENDGECSNVSKNHIPVQTSKEYKKCIQRDENICEGDDDCKYSNKYNVCYPRDDSLNLDFIDTMKRHTFSLYDLIKDSDTQQEENSFSYGILKQGANFSDTVTLDNSDTPIMDDEVPCWYLNYIYDEKIESCAQCSPNTEFKIKDDYSDGECFNELTCDIYLNTEVKSGHYSGEDSITPGDFITNVFNNKCSCTKNSKSKDGVVDDKWFKPNCDKIYGDIHLGECLFQNLGNDDSQKYSESLYSSCETLKNGLIVPRKDNTYDLTLKDIGYEYYYLKNNDGKYEIDYEEISKDDIKPYITAFQNNDKTTGIRNRKHLCEYNGSYGTCESCFNYEEMKERQRTIDGKECIDWCEWNEGLGELSEDLPLYHPRKIIKDKCNAWGDKIVNFKDENYPTYISQTEESMKKLEDMLNKGVNDTFIIFLELYYTDPDETDNSIKIPNIYTEDKGYYTINDYWREPSEIGSKLIHYSKDYSLLDLEGKINKKNKIFSFDDEKVDTSPESIHKSRRFIAIDTLTKEIFDEKTPISIDSDFIKHKVLFEIIFSNTHNVHKIATSNIDETSFTFGLNFEEKISPVISTLAISQDQKIIIQNVSIINDLNYYWAYIGNGNYGYIHTPVGGGLGDLFDITVINPDVVDDLYFKNGRITSFNEYMYYKLRGPLRNYLGETFLSDTENVNEEKTVFHIPTENIEISSIDNKLEVINILPFVLYNSLMKLDNGVSTRFAQIEVGIYRRDGAGPDLYSLGGSNLPPTWNKVAYGTILNNNNYIVNNPLNVFTKFVPQDTYIKPVPLEDQRRDIWNEEKRIKTLALKSCMLDVCFDSVRSILSTYESSLDIDTIALEISLNIYFSNYLFYYHVTKQKDKYFVDTENKSGDYSYFESVMIKVIKFAIDNNKYLPLSQSFEGHEPSEFTYLTNRILNKDSGMTNILNFPPSTTGLPADSRSFNKYTDMETGTGINRNKINKEMIYDYYEYDESCLGLGIFIYNIEDMFDDVLKDLPNDDKKTLRELCSASVKSVVSLTTGPSLNIIEYIFTKSFSWVDNKVSSIIDSIIAEFISDDNGDLTITRDMFNSEDGINKYVKQLKEYLYLDVISDNTKCSVYLGNMNTLVTESGDTDTPYDFHSIIPELKPLKMENINTSDQQIIYDDSIPGGTDYIDKEGIYLRTFLGQYSQDILKQYRYDDTVFYPLKYPVPGDNIGHGKVDYLTKVSLMDKLIELCNEEDRDGLKDLDENTDRLQTFLEDFQFTNPTDDNNYIDINKIECIEIKHLYNSFDYTKDEPNEIINSTLVTYKSEHHNEYCSLIDPQCSAPDEDGSEGSNVCEYNTDLPISKTFIDIDKIHYLDNIYQYLSELVPSTESEDCSECEINENYNWRWPLSQESTYRSFIVDENESSKLLDTRNNISDEYSKEIFANINVYKNSQDDNINENIKTLNVQAPENTDSQNDLNSIYYADNPSDNGCLRYCSVAESCSVDIDEKQTNEYKHISDEDKEKYNNIISLTNRSELDDGFDTGECPPFMSKNEVDGKCTHYDNNTPFNYLGLATEKVASTCGIDPAVFKRNLETFHKCEDWYLKPSLSEEEEISNLQRCKRDIEGGSELILTKDDHLQNKKNIENHFINAKNNPKSCKLDQTEDTRDKDTCINFVSDYIIKEKIEELYKTDQSENPKNINNRLYFIDNYKQDEKIKPGNKQPFYSNLNIPPPSPLDPDLTKNYINKFFYGDFEYARYIDPEKWYNYVPGSGKTHISELKKYYTKIKEDKRSVTLTDSGDTQTGDTQTGESLLGLSTGSGSGITTTILDNIDTYMTNHSDCREGWPFFNT